MHIHVWVSCLSVCLTWDITMHCKLRKRLGAGGNVTVLPGYYICQFHHRSIIFSKLYTMNV